MTATPLTDISPRNCLVVCGPTASGKTALGVQLALDLSGEILSADSRQVYRGMDLATGKDLEEYTTSRGTVPYHLIDVAEPQEIYSLYHYQRDFYRVFEEVSARGRLPVIVGGTGLYVEATLRKFPVPNVPADEPFRAEMEARELADLAAELESRAPAIAERTVIDCKRRVIRALEVARHTERFGEPRVNRTSVDFRPLVLVVTWPAEELRDRIRARLLARLEAGMVEEVRALIDSGISRERFALFGMEQKHIARHLAGEVSREGMVEDLSIDIGQLAKRQRTYFRGIRKRGMQADEVPRADLQLARAVVKGYGEHFVGETVSGQTNPVPARGDELGLGGSAACRVVASEADGDVVDLTVLRLADQSTSGVDERALAEGSAVGWLADPS